MMKNRKRDEVQEEKGCEAKNEISSRLGGESSTKIGLATPMAPPCPQLGAGYSLTKCMLTS